jgi:mono/diheme cytochrome c family protein
MDFTGGLTAKHNRAYDTIRQHKLIAWSNVGEDARITMPLEFGSHKSKLVESLRSGPCSKRAQLGKDDWYRLVTWIDANGPYHDGFINKRLPQPPYDLPADMDLAARLAAVHARRCAGCHTPSEVTRLDWIDLRRPRESRFLAAPLAKAASGQGKCKDAVYKDPNDPDYQAVRQLVEAAVERAWQQPRRDVKGIRAEPRVSSRR